MLDDMLDCHRQTCPMGDIMYLYCRKVHTSDLDGQVFVGPVGYQSELVDMVCFCQSSGYSGQFSRSEMITTRATII